MSSAAGIKKAKVFPDPVLAAPTKSLPSNKTGMDLAWISVIVVNPISCIAFKVCSHTFSFNEEKLLSLMTSNPKVDPGTVKELYWNNRDWLLNIIESYQSQ